MQILEQNYIMLKDKEIRMGDQIEHMRELIDKMEMSSAKMEESAFDSINTTDKVMLAMREVMTTMSAIINAQQELCSMVEVCSMLLDEKESESMQKLIEHQSVSLEKLEYQISQATQAAVEANDAAHCIESGIAAHGELAYDLIQTSKEIMYAEE